MTLDALQSAAVSLQLDPCPTGRTSQNLDKIGRNFHGRNYIYLPENDSRCDSATGLFKGYSSPGNRILRIGPPGCAGLRPACPPGTRVALSRKILSCGARPPGCAGLRPACPPAPSRFEMKWSGEAAVRAWQRLTPILPIPVAGEYGSLNLKTCGPEARAPRVKANSQQLTANN